MGDTNLYVLMFVNAFLINLSLNKRMQAPPQTPGKFMYVIRYRRSIRLIYNP